jgi:FKBP-type peptidyl-prolyl cis-trans isomerase
MSSLTVMAQEERATQQENVATAETPDTDWKLSCALGMETGAFLKEVPEFEFELFIWALQDTVKDGELLLKPDQASALRQAFYTKIQERKLEAVGEKNRPAGEVFFAANKEREGGVTTASGLQYIMLRDGDGPQPLLTDRVTVHYRGGFIDGTEFSNSYRQGSPDTVPLSDGIPGWIEALQLMKVGSKFRFFIPSDLAYGQRGVLPQIGPNATLIFEVELLGIEN